LCLTCLEGVEARDPEEPTMPGVKNIMNGDLLPLTEINVKKKPTTEIRRTPKLGQKKFLKF
jgi:hypothetical protein